MAGKQLLKITRLGLVRVTDTGKSVTGKEPARECFSSQKSGGALQNMKIRKTKRERRITASVNSVERRGKKMSNLPIGAFLTHDSFDIGLMSRMITVVRIQLQMWDVEVWRGTRGEQLISFYRGMVGQSKQRV